MGHSIWYGRVVAGKRHPSKKVGAKKGATNCKKKYYILYYRTYDVSSPMLFDTFAPFFKIGRYLYYY